jgi:hypothetical protein
MIEEYAEQSANVRVRVCLDEQGYPTQDNQDGDFQETQATQATQATQEQQVFDSDLKAWDEEEETIEKCTYQRKCEQEVDMTEDIQEWLDKDTAAFQKEMLEAKKIEDELKLQREANKPTEQEMDEALAEFRKMGAAEKQEKKEFQTRLEKIVELWYNSHLTTTTINMFAPFEEQWATMAAEKKVEDTKAVAEKSKKAATEAKQREIQMKEMNKTNAIAREAKKANKPNAKGKLQGVKAGAKEAVAHKKGAKEALKAEAKTAEVEVPKGKRAKRREVAEKRVVQIVPRETMVPQIELEEDEVEDEVEEEIVEEEVEVEVVAKVKPVEVKVEVEVIEEEDNIDDLIEMVTGKKVEKPAPEKPVTKGKKEMVKMDIKIGQTYIEQKYPKVESVVYATEVYSDRCKGFEVLGDKKKQEEQFARTKMCNSIGSGYKCKHGSKCRFAHSTEELTVRECRFGNGCRFADTCTFKHPGETKEQYLIRQGVKVATPALAKVEVKAVPKVEVKASAPVAPKTWAKVEVPKTAEPKTAEPKKTRWDEPKAAPVQVPRKTRFEPAPAKAQEQAPEKVIRVPKAMFEAAMKMCLTQGMTNFRIEISE